VRKEIARVLTVINTGRKNLSRDNNKKGSFRHLDLRIKKTRAIR